MTMRRLDTPPPERPPAIGRLRAVRLRPTAARIGILLAVEAAGQPLSAEDVFRHLVLRGTPASVGTIYRALQALQAKGLLLREWDAQRKARYRARGMTHDGLALQLVCGENGRTVMLEDPALHARLVEAAARAGVDVAGQPLCVHAGGPVQAAAVHPG